MQREENISGQQNHENSGEAHGGEEMQEPEAGAQSGGTSEPQPDMESLLKADFLLYNVDCGGADTDGFGGEEMPGLFQSVNDQAYGQDAVTGKSWGYRPEAYLVREEDSLGSGFLATKWVVDRDADTDFGQTAICYDFQVPEGNYEVTMSLYNPFGVRKIQVDCEGEQVIGDEKILSYMINKQQFEVQVTDGCLNLKVYNSRAKTFMDTPILSYVRIRAVPEYDKELIQTALEKLKPQEGEEAYTTASYTAYREVCGEVQKTLEEGAEADYREQYEKLRDACGGLRKKYRYDAFHPGEVWEDTEGTLIQAHGGQVQRLSWKDEATGETIERWVWVGEDKTAGYRGGICAYSSEDLYNWQFEGVIMRNVSSREALDTEAYFREVYEGYTPQELDNVYLCINDTTSVIERPKLIYNDKTGQYILWFHADGPTAQSDANYAAACAGVAVSDSPFGPYRFIDRYRLNTCPPDQEDKYPQSRGMARDMNLFKDTDGTAYIIYSSEENLTLYISKLNEEYTYLAVAPEEAVYGRDYVRLFPGAQREAPALFLRDGTYYLMTSGCTGWAPNQAGYYMADSVLGEWVSMGDPCVGDQARTTFDSQSTCIFLEPESGTWIYMGDRWNPEDLCNSRYVWLPVSFGEDGGMSITFAEEWKLER